MVAEVGVHDDDEVARCELEAVDVGGAEAELACARPDLDVRGVDFGKLRGDFLGTVGGAVVYDDELPVEVAARGGQYLGVRNGVMGGREEGGAAYFSVKVLLSSQVMMGRLRRSL